MTWKNEGPRSTMSIVWLALFAYLAWAGFLFVSQRSMMYPGAGVGAAWPPPPPGVESVGLELSDASSVEAWFVPAVPDRVSEGPAVVLAHGNAETIDSGMREARALAAMGLSVLLVEYPGYRGAGGRPSRETIAEVFRAGYDGLVARPEVDPDRVVGFGRSLGTGVVTDLARDRSLRALVLVSPFTATAHFARRYLLPGALVRDRFDNLSLLRQFEGPVLLIHGKYDRIIPHTHSERLAEATPSAELVSLECGHNDCPPDWDAYVTVLRSFLERHGLTREAS